MPYLAIFDGNKAPIFDNKSGLTIGQLMTSFQFTYDEDKPNSAEITLETDNPNLADIPQLQYQMPLRLQWGWIFDDGSSISSPVRSVIVLNHKIQWMEDCIKVVILCGDASILLQQQPARLFQQSNDFRDWMVNLLQGRIGIKFLDYEKKTNLNLRVARREVQQPAPEPITSPIEFPE